MAEIVCFLSLLMGLRSHNTCNQGNKYMEIYRTILCINIWSKRLRSYIYITLKFHDYSSIFTAFDIAHKHSEPRKYHKHELVLLI